MDLTSSTENLSELIELVCSLEQRCPNIDPELADEFTGASDSLKLAYECFRNLETCSSEQRIIATLRKAKDKFSSTPNKDDKGAMATAAFASELFRDAVRRALTRVDKSAVKDSRLAALEARWLGFVLRDLSRRKAFREDPDNNSQNSTSPGLEEAISLLYQLWNIDGFPGGHKVTTDKLYKALSPDNGFVTPIVQHTGWRPAAQESVEVVIRITGKDAARKVLIEATQSADEENQPVPPYWEDLNETAVWDLLEIMLHPGRERFPFKLVYEKPHHRISNLLAFACRPLALLVRKREGLAFYQRIEGANRFAPRALASCCWFFILLVLCAIPAEIFLYIKNKPSFHGYVLATLITCFLIYLFLAAISSWLLLIGVGWGLTRKLTQPLLSYSRNRHYRPINIAVIGSTGAGKSTWLANLLHAYHEQNNPLGRGFVKTAFVQSLGATPSTPKSMVVSLVSEGAGINGYPSQPEITTALDTRGQSLQGSPDVRSLVSQLEWVHAIVLVRQCVVPGSNGVPGPDYMENLVAEIRGMAGASLRSKQLLILLTFADAEGCENVTGDAAKAVAALKKYEWGNTALVAKTLRKEAPEEIKPAINFALDNWVSGRVGQMFDDWTSEKAIFILGRDGYSGGNPRFLTAPPPHAAKVVKISNSREPYDFAVSNVDSNDVTFVMLRNLKRMRGKQNFIIDRWSFFLSSVICILVILVAAFKS